jgi:hypothetical protein
MNRLKQLKKHILIYIGTCSNINKDIFAPKYTQQNAPINGLSLSNITKAMLKSHA